MASHEPLTTQEFERVLRIKADANQLFGAGECQRALDGWTAALQVYGDRYGSPEQRFEKGKLHSNKAEAALKLELYDVAVVFATESWTPRTASPTAWTEVHGKQPVAGAPQKRTVITRPVSHCSRWSCTFAPPGHEFTEDDWAGAGPYETLEEKWKGGWTIEKNAYAVGKVECEKMTYRWGDENGVEVITSCPNHVIGPLLAKAHDTM